MSRSIVKEKSFLFAIRVVKLYKILCDERKDYVLGKQLMRCGSSIGANIREALNAESDADFIHKMSIAQKECDESLYWLELLQKTDYLTAMEYSSLNNDAEELLKMIRSIILTKKRKKLITYNS